MSWNADEIILTGRSCIQAFEVEQQVSLTRPKHVDSSFSILHIPDLKDHVTKPPISTQEFGRGRRRWSPWSSLVSCAIVLEGTENRRKSEFSCGKWLRSNDCGKRVRFRVLGHNIFNVERPRSSSTHEGVLIQCKNNIRGKRVRRWFHESLVASGRLQPPARVSRNLINMNLLCRGKLN